MSLIIIIMVNFIKKIIKLEKALHALVLQIEKQFLTEEKDVEKPHVLCPFLPPKPDIKLNQGKGFRINFIRVIYALWSLGFFVDRKGRKLTQKEVFQAFEQLLEVDFSNFHKDLDRSKQEGTDLKTQMNIFDKMKKVILDFFESWVF